MADLHLRFACGLYDRVLPLYRGIVKAEGISLDFQAIDDPRQIVGKMERGELDVGEMFGSDHVARIATGNTEFVALPVFVSRVFRHGFIFCNRNAGIVHPKDLEGKRVGFYSYKQSAAIFIRGLLEHEYGVDLSAIRWILGSMNRGAEDARHGEAAHGDAGMFQTAGGTVMLPKLTKAIDVIIDRSGKSLSDQLAAGEIDAVIGAIAPDSFGRHPDVQRLFPNLRAVTKDYFRRTRIFPIMHLIALRRDIHEKYPAAAASLYRAFERAKDAAFLRMREVGALAYMLPWLSDDIDELEDMFGADPWPYGIEANRPTLTALVTYMAEQGLIASPPPIETLFVPGPGEE